MRRWNVQTLVALLLAALVAAVLNTPRGAMAATPSVRSPISPSMTFKGKVVAKNTATNYFVLTFACSGGTLITADWTYEVTSSQSFTGTIGAPSTGSLPPTCALVQAANGVTYATPASIPLAFNGTNVTGTLNTLTFTNIMASKTYFGVAVPISPTVAKDCTLLTSTTCVRVQTDALTIPTTPMATSVPAFILGNSSFSTLNLSAQ